MWADDALPIILPEKGKAHGTVTKSKKGREIDSD